MNSEETQGHGTPPIASLEFVRRAKAVVSAWPSTLDARMKQRPYATLGVALAIGVGAGVLLGSRILRTVLASVASYTVVELGRAYLQQSVGSTAPASR